MKKLMVYVMVLVLSAGILSACGGGGSEAKKDVPVEDILQAVKDAYGDAYLPNAELDAATLDEMYDIDMELIDTFVAEMPMIGFHPDRVIIAKAVEGKGAELEEEFLELKEYLIQDSFMYPANIAKTQAAEVVRNGDYAAFLLVGAANENLDASEEDQLKFAQEETKKAVEAFEACFQ